MMEYFHDRSMRTYIPKGTSREGFMHTNLDFGVKYLSVVLFHPGHTRQFAFVVDVPAIETDYQRVDFDALVPPRNQQAVDREGLQRALEVLPCCTLGPDTESPGDPLNIIVIGQEEKAFPPFVRRGWDVTEPLSSSSVWRRSAPRSSAPATAPPQCRRYFMTAVGENRPAKGPR
jgi:hypothetical protein